jgi:N-acetylmuramoyl-L-alanine amidase
MGMSWSCHIALGALLWVGAGTQAHARAPKVLVDPGHGGSQHGAVGATGALEKDVALAISRLLGERLQAQLGAQVVYTREGDQDLPLADRVSAANAQAPDLFISIHANSMPSRKVRAQVQGIETYFLSTSASGADAARTAARENADGPKAQPRADDPLAHILSDLARTEAHQDSSRLAYAVHMRLVAQAQAVDRGVQQAPFYVLSGLGAPAILVEVGFISHPVEGKRLTTRGYQERLATGIAEGVKAFWAERGGGRAAAPVSLGQP